jgi:hypothetical protein
MKDVKQIHDIPNIEKYLDRTFNFSYYEKGSDMICYESIEIDSDQIVSIEMITEESFILAEQTLYEILDFDNIGYFRFSILLNEDEILDSYSYRPFVSEDKKNFI